MIKIAIADDEYEAREVLAEQLAKRSAEWTIVGTARNGQEAVELVILHQPDILITDISMPGLSGIDVMKKLRAIGSETTVILLSGYSEFEYAREAVSMGAFDYLLKPTPYREIVDTIRRAQAKREKESGRKPAAEPEPGSGKDTFDQVRMPVQYVLDQIRDYYATDLSLRTIAERLGMNADYLSTLFRSEVGATFLESVMAYRMERAKALLRELDLKVYEAGARVGYKNYKHFAKQFKQWTGMTPLAYKNQRDE